MGFSLAADDPRYGQDLTYAGTCTVDLPMLGKVSIFNLLGAGSNCLVYEGKCKEGTVVIKELFPKILAQTGEVLRDTETKELQGVTKENYRSAVTKFDSSSAWRIGIHDTDPQFGTPVERYFNWPLLEGGRYSWADLSGGVALNKSSGVNSAQEAILVTINLLEDIKRMHSHNPSLLHLDIRPDNVLLYNRMGTMRKGSLLDFDSIMLKSEAQGGSACAFSNTSYCPPEQPDLYYALNESSDIYALGGILYFLLSKGSDPPSFNTIYNWELDNCSLFKMDVQATDSLTREEFECRAHYWDCRDNLENKLPLLKGFTQEMISYVREVLSNTIAPIDKRYSFNGKKYLNSNSTSKCLEDLLNELSGCSGERVGLMSTIGENAREQLLKTGEEVAAVAAKKAIEAYVAGTASQGDADSGTGSPSEPDPTSRPQECLYTQIANRCSSLGLTIDQSALDSLNNYTQLDEDDPAASTVIDLIIADLERGRTISPSQYGLV